MKCKPTFFLASAAFALIVVTSCGDESESGFSETQSDRAESPYAMVFSAEQQLEREAKWTESGARRIELSSGHKVFTQTFGENPEVCILALHGGPAATHEYLLSLATNRPRIFGTLIDGWRKSRRFGSPLVMMHPIFICSATVGEGSSRWNTLCGTKSTSTVSSFATWFPAFLNMQITMSRS